MILLLWFSIITLFLMLSFELLLRFLVKKHGNRLKEFPKSTMEQLSRFKNYDEELGWETKPTGPIIDYGHSNVLEHGQSIAKYSINMDGSRYQPSEGNNKGILVEFFGDSACFCRDVNDNETFQSYLENDLDFGVCKNYGVGNYGPDQAVIRAKRKMKGNSIGVLYMPISSLTRILTVYKQYSEITNCWAVKPRYIIKNQKLVLINRPFTNIEELMDLSKYKDHLRKYDYYYQSFKKKELSKKNCYIAYFLRNVDILRSLVFEMRNKNNKHVFDKIIKFLIIIRFNILINHIKIIINRDNNKDSTIDYLLQHAKNETGDLFAKICNEFYNLCKQRNSVCYIAISPQGTVNNLKKYDETFNVLKAKISKENPNIKCIDIGNILIKRNNNEFELLGAKSVHLNKKGNYAVAKLLKNTFKKDSHELKKGYINELPTGAELRGIKPYKE